MQTAKWPKVLPVLTPEQQQRSDQFMKLWHELLPNRYGMIEKFNHSFPVKFSNPGFTTTLEVGAGLGGRHACGERVDVAGGVVVDAAGNVAACGAAIWSHQPLSAEPCEAVQQAAAGRPQQQQLGPAGK